MIESLSPYLEIICTIVAVSTLYWRISVRYIDRAEKKNLEMQEEYDGKIHVLQAQIDEWESQRKTDVRALHNRINEQDEFVKTSIIGQLSEMRGEMRGMSNILTIIQEHFVRTGAGER